MFRIGEFSKIAQVSGRLLRYYDQIGLLTPTSIDPQTGYRFYSATQLPQLNQILALKELGLTLEQISQLVSNRVTPEDIRGMFLLRKAQIEQALQAEQRRLRAIESRIQRLDHPETADVAEVVIKSLPAQRFLATRDVFTSLAGVRAVVGEIHASVVAHGKDLMPGPFVIVIHSDVYEPEQLDCELGQVIQAADAPSFTLVTGQIVSLRVLPAVARAATLVHIGPLESKHLAYQALGGWLEANAYRMSGPGREVFLRLPVAGAGVESTAETTTEAVIEVQLPIEPLNQTGETGETVAPA